MYIEWIRISTKPDVLYIYITVQLFLVAIGAYVLTLHQIVRNYVILY